MFLIFLIKGKIYLAGLFCWGFTPSNVVNGGTPPVVDSFVVAKVLYFGKAKPNRVSMPKQTIK